MSKHRDGSIDKSARLVLLMRWQDAGRLEGLTVREIAAQFFPKGPHFTTIARDLRDVERLRRKIQEMETK